MTPGLPEEDADAHTRPNPEARSSSAPELPLAGEEEDDGEPPGLDDESTIDYRDQEEVEEDQEVDDEGDLNLDKDDSRKGFFEEWCTRVEDAPIEALDVQNGAKQLWANADREVDGVSIRGDVPLAGTRVPIEMELSHQMSLLLVPF